MCIGTSGNRCTELRQSARPPRRVAMMLQFRDCSLFHLFSRGVAGEIVVCFWVISSVIAYARWKTVVMYSSRRHFPGLKIAQHYRLCSGFSVVDFQPLFGSPFFLLRFCCSFESIELPWTALVFGLRARCGTTIFSSPRLTARAMNYIKYIFLCDYFNLFERFAVKTELYVHCVRSARQTV